ncbi:hypothetical protein HN446_01250 [bacterium]|jgi:hypothetical protein|nr:hypothetical protein [bacterium]
MKRVRKIAYKLLYGAVVTILASCLGGAVGALGKDMKYVVHSGDHLSEKAVQIIYSDIDSPDTSFKNPQKLYEKLQHDVPVISQATLVYTSPSEVSVNLKLQHPRLVVNDKYLIMENESVVSADLFKNSIVSPLPHINMDHDDISHQFSACVNNLPEDVFKDYEVKWEDNTRIKLQDKHDDKFSIIASCSSLPDKLLLSACQKVKEKELSAKPRYLKKNRKWVADIRFKEQIVFKEEGE